METERETTGRMKIFAKKEKKKTSDKDLLIKKRGKILKNQQ